MKEKLSKRQRDFVRIYRKNAGDLIKTASEMGLSANYCEKLLGMNPVKEQLLKSQQDTREKLSLATPYLLEKALQMIDDTKTSEKVKSNLILGLLDRGGITTPKEAPVTFNINTTISDRARQLLSESLIDVT